MIAFALVASFSLLNSAYGQARSQDNVVVKSMDVCGNSIELGMFPKAALNSFVEGSECTAYKTSGEDLFAIGKGKDQIGTIKFTHGIVSSITREWAVDIKTPEEFAKALVNALQEVKSHSSGQCVLKDINQASPSSEVRGAVLTCGERVLVFSTFNEAGQNKFLIEEILSN